MSKFGAKADKESAIYSNELIEIPSSKINKLERIGSGGFADVYCGTWQGLNIAIKQLHLKIVSPSLVQDFLNEAQILAKCRHPSVVTFFGISIQEGCYQLILELMLRGTLFQNLSNSSLPLPVPLRLQMCLDMSRGVEYLHDLNIIHCDLKSTNILIGKDWQAKITDFGLSKIKIATETTFTTERKAASIRWSAPELFKRNSPRTKKSDLWSLGMVIHEVFSRKVPFAEEPNETIVIQWINNGEKEHISSECPSALSEVVTKCWNMDPKERPDPSSIIQTLKNLIIATVEEISSSKTLIVTDEVQDQSVTEFAHKPVLLYPTKQVIAIK